MVTPDRMKERLDRLPRGWVVAPLDQLPSVQIIGYGITRPGAHVDGGVGMVRAADIQDGRLHSDEPRRISLRTHQENVRSELRAGDVLIVLVGRVGEAAVVTDEYQGWNAARTVALVRTADPDAAAWLRLWLGSSYVRDWCKSRVTGSTLQRTLNLKVLRGLPVPLPPLKARAAFLRTTEAVERKAAVNSRIAECAMSLSDALFAVETQDTGTWPARPFGALAQLRSGHTSRPREDAAQPEESSPGTAVPFLAPADVLRSGLPYVSRTDTWLASPDADSVCAPRSLLLATREDGVHAVLNEIPVVPGRGILALRPETPADAYWLLHEVRARSGELTAAAQGPGGRELSRNVFAATTVPWPPTSVRDRFAQLTGKLHERARAACAENEILNRLHERILDGFLDGAPSAGGAPSYP
ncbi:hypothetical protein ACFYWO_19805 [Streptomyces sp. NPDC002932]|uniref:hypothetical protein n=1 Tax=Streptomyces sp. NPDC002932 TaxID=3364672 RepID=UPI003697AD5E